jgi:hypothetical protein
LAVKRQMSRRELKMLAMAKRASATKVGCHISQLSRVVHPLYWGGGGGQEGHATYSGTAGW